ncbi:MAG: hypothetical protein WCA17_11925 [Burkholderiales bacterium]
MLDLAQTLRTSRYNALFGDHKERSRVDMTTLIFAIGFVMLGCMFGVVAMSLAVMAKDVGGQEAETARQRRLRVPR